jgi:hypothetical protein
MTHGEAMMRGLLRSLLAFITLGTTSMACNKSDTPSAPTDVTLHVPGMY